MEVFSGILTFVGEEKTYNGGVVREIVVTDDPKAQYPETAVFSVFGAKSVELVNNYNVGDHIDVSFNYKAREYNGRWYNSLKVWRFGIEYDKEQQPTSQPVQQTVPQAVQTLNKSVAVEPVQQDDEEELPF